MNRLWTRRGITDALFKAEESVSISRRSTQALTASSTDPSLSLRLSFPPPARLQCSFHSTRAARPPAPKFTSSPGILLIFRFDCRGGYDWVDPRCGAMRRKRKGIRPPDTVGLCRTDDFDTARQIKKQCGEDWKASRDQKVGSGSGRGEKRRLCAGGAASRVVMTAPPSVRLAADLPGRGLKRKLGCMEPATRIGRTEKLEDEYVLGHKIGKGRFGSVRLCRSKVDGKEFACKTLRKDGDETVHREVEIMQHISGHPGIVTLKAVFEDEKSFHLVMELCYGGRLIDQINKEVRYSEQRAAILLKELVTIIKYCHEMGVVHRDIKPENILLTASGKIKLADFGISPVFIYKFTIALCYFVGCHPNLVDVQKRAITQIAQDANKFVFTVMYANIIIIGQKLSGRAGSPAYVAPEVLLGDYSEKVDIWAAGVLLHVLLVGALPFKGHSREAVFEEIKFTELDFVSGTWASVSDLAKDLVCRMLTRDTSKRITIDEILLHPWILFYTKCPSELMPRKPRIRSSKPILAMERIAALISSSLTTESSSNTRSEEQHDGNCFVDVLATAMARVSISETKRSRLCGPMHPIQQQRSSNMEANLCTAF
ncbi:hypothetical protein ZIOFF_064370 [Zingiber officinale]|uniref:Protein kinase domain-containing protein n=1 Tax=Zingiber officinale TaxID=94328 RepID=A0A8J5EWY8_ZINOF|nr:hypothetical protein ZIOFF_064370 [Zingiber officinale]